MNAATVSIAALAFKILIVFGCSWAWFRYAVRLYQRGKAPTFVAVAAFVTTVAILASAISWEQSLRPVQTIQTPKPEAQEIPGTPVRPATKESLEDKSARLRQEAEAAREETKRQYDQIK